MPMDENERSSTPRRMDQLLEEASFWFARMRAPDAEQHRAAFEAWLNLGAAHLGAYNRAGEIFALGKFMAEDVAANDDQPPALVHHKWKLAAGFASILLVAGVGVWVERGSTPPASAPVVQIASASSTWRNAAAQSYATRPGETKAIRLADGSKVTLGRGSALSTRFDSARRELRLERGNARFEVAHEVRPFVVLAGGGSVTARGTIFDVMITRNRGVTVRLLRGVIDVARPAAGPGSDGTKLAVTRLEAGEALNFGDTQLTSMEILRPHMSAELSAEPLSGSPSGIREFDQVPLSAVVAEANRGSGTRIRVVDPSVGALKVSGRFRVDDPDLVADRLASLFDLQVKRGPKEILLQAH